ncbi:MAG: DinB/UmuC family translesion DNA polymerase [Gemmatimonadota bacterium]
MFVCLYAPAWPDLASSPLPAELLAIVPRITIAADVVWADAHGLPAHEVSLELLARADASGVSAVRAGVARIPIVAELAAKTAQPQTVVVVDDDERAFIAPIPLDALIADARLRNLLQSVGVTTCSELAALDREAVEVRFGAEAVAPWQWSRAVDERRVFNRIAPERLHASTEFIDYVVTDPERLIFVANSMFSGLCDRLRARGEHARRVLLTLSLGNRTSWQRTIRPARPTANRGVWLRLTRALLEHLTVPDAVTGIEIEVVATEPAAAVQGDLFDAGFATASAVEDAVARLVELQGNVVVKPERNQHPLVEQRTTWVADEALSATADTVTPELRLQLLPEPREVLVETVNRRDHIIPIRFRDGKWKQLVSAAGPDRISGGKWDVAYAREYFRGVTVEGQLIWLFRDGRQDRWFVHGYWD